MEEFLTQRFVSVDWRINDNPTAHALIRETIEITLPKSACLVLFELLTASYEQWRKVNPNDECAQPLLITAVEYNERVALWKLEGALERTMPELFSSNYSDLLAESKKLLDKGV